MAALNDNREYYGTPGNAAAADVNAAAMMRSVGKFIGPDGCDCFPTSQYDIQ